MPNAGLGQGDAVPQRSRRSGTALPPLPWKQQRRGPDGVDETRFSRSAVFRRQSRACSRCAERRPFAVAHGQPASGAALVAKRMAGRSRTASLAFVFSRALPLLASAWLLVPRMRSRLHEAIHDRRTAPSLMDDRRLPIALAATASIRIVKSVTSGRRQPSSGGGCGPDA